QRVIEKVFVPADAEWRGIGVIPMSGLELREEFSEYDALKKFKIELRDAPDPPGCRCGDVLKGVLLPPECPLFGKKCKPESPVGPCMVSSEGSCAAYYKYGGAE
ncbi:MAG: hydrogenase formation protein HypD, partial [Deltaproteobacteria bacterium]